MFKYLILCASLMLALPSYAAGLSSGTWSQMGTSFSEPYTEINLREAAGDMRIQAMGIKLNAGVDNPFLTDFSSSQTQPFKYPNYLGFYGAMAGEKTN